MRLFAPWLDRDDYAQEAAIAAWRGRNVRLHLIDVTKTATRRKHRLLSERVPLDDTLPAGDSTVEAVLAREQLAELVAGVHALPTFERRCLLAVANGAAYEIEGASRKQVDNALQR